jgi:hypothetical protein
VGLDEEARFLSFFLIVLLNTLVLSQATTSPSQTPVRSPQASSSAAIHFSYEPISFQLDSSETPQRHAPETMAGGVAIFDYNSDGKLDIFSRMAPISTRLTSLPLSTPTDCFATTGMANSPMLRLLPD